MKIRDGRGGLELDYNQRQNDERLQDLERRLKRAYKQAGEGLKEKLADFMAQFEEADAHMLEAVEAGEITQAAYTSWRRDNTFRKRQLEEQITSITNDLVNADRIAVDMINGDLPEVYASSYNFGLYRSDIQAMAAGQYTGASFTAYNADALRIIQEEDPDLIPWDRAALNESVDLQWTRAHVQNAVMQGILQGDSINELSSRIERIVGMNENSARRTARTSYTSVQNQARREATQRARDNGYNMTETWYSVLQDNTRDTHLLLNGTNPNAAGLFGEGIIASGHLLRWPGDPQGDPEQIYNCQCRVSSTLDGVDHSRDAELYAEFMQQNYPEDWFGSNGREGVVNYRREETARALERRRQLMTGERENRETAAYLRRQQEQAATRLQAPEMPQATRNALNDFERRRGGASREYYRAIDRDGNVIFDDGGRARSVSVPDYVNRDSEGGYSIHNHPVDVIFSAQDIENYERYGINGVVYTRAGNEYILYNTRPAVWRELEALTDVEKVNGGAAQLLPFSTECRRVFDEIENDILREKRDMYDYLMQQGNSREQIRNAIDEWRAGGNTADARQMRWLEENAERYGFIFEHNTK